MERGQGSRITLRSSFKYLLGKSSNIWVRSPWEGVSLSQYYLHLGSIILACGKVILCIGGCLAGSLVSTHQLPVTQTNPPPPPVWTEDYPDTVNITPGPSRAQIRLGTESSSTLKYCLTHCLTHSIPSTRVQTHVFPHTSCVSLT